MHKEKNSILRTALLFGFVVLSNSATFSQVIPDTDRRLSEIRHLDLTYNFPEYSKKEEWSERASALKKQILFSAGLWPIPAKLPIKAVIFGKVERDDYTIEKVYFESFSGFYVTGNLYRPKNVIGKLPAVLCPHGHWSYGRFENTVLNSGPARAANFARQGYVAFNYDMIGYGDSTAISHRFADHNTSTREVLWNINLLGLQLWNSIRSLDFLLTLPEVDPQRIACTGESGGGTQTFLLMAVDDRVRVAAPVNMISFHMQGGSLCENAPNLRIDTNNVEYGALMAPRPLILISATGDWTKNTLSAEYPAIRGIYRLLGAEDNVTAVQMNAPHNYNQESREAVYGWFAHWLLGRKESGPIKERNTSIAPLSDLMVFFGRSRPEGEVNESRLSAYLIEGAKKQFEKSMPSDTAGLENFRKVYGVGLKQSVMAEYPDPDSVFTSNPRVTSLKESAVSREEFELSRKGKGDRIPVTLWRRPSPKSVTLLISPKAGNDASAALAEMLYKNGHTVALIQSFPGGRQVPGNIKFFTTYNRTDEANRVQDILTAIAYLKKNYAKSPLNMVGQGEAGLWALLARGLAPRLYKVVIDAAQFDNSRDEEFIEHLPVPGIRRAGDFRTAVMMAPSAPLLIHNTANKFDTTLFSAFYDKFGRSEDFKTQTAEINSTIITNWLR